MSFKILSAVIAVLVPSVAQAQYQMVSPMLYEGPRISLQNHARQSGVTTSSRGERPADPQSQQGRPVVDARLFSYRPDLTQRRANLAAFVEKSRPADPRGAANLAQLFAQGDIIERMRPELAKFDLRIDNVADAYACWLINAWQASRGSNDEAGAAIAAAVKRQVMASMAANGKFTGSSDAVKQEMAESLLVQSLLLAGALSQAKDNPGQLATLGRAARAGAQGMGVDLAAITLTEDGFVPVK